MTRVSFQLMSFWAPCCGCSVESVEMKTPLVLCTPTPMVMAPSGNTEPNRVACAGTHDCTRAQPRGPGSGPRTAGPHSAGSGALPFCACADTTGGSRINCLFHRSSSCLLVSASSRDMIIAHSLIGMTSLGMHGGIPVCFVSHWFCHRTQAKAQHLDAKAQEIGEAQLPAPAVQLHPLPMLPVDQVGR